MTTRYLLLQMKKNPSQHLESFNQKPVQYSITSLFKDFAACIIDLLYPPYIIYCISIYICKLYFSFSNSPKSLRVLTRSRRAKKKKRRVIEVGDKSERLKNVVMVGERTHHGFESSWDRNPASEQ